MMEQNGNVLFGSNALKYLEALILSCKEKDRKVFFLVDSNTAELCLPLFYKLINTSSINIHVIAIPAGEAYKNLDTLSQIWRELTEKGAGRDALLINLGGGMVTDIGGFAASCFKRGIETIHIPTTLLGMVDAAIGGKTGIDFNYFKNHIGSFYQASQVLVMTDFLSTLPARQLMSGFGELLKYGFIANPRLLKADPFSFDSHYEWLELIKVCAATKIEITIKDPTEKGVRKLLNFGHTIGHAFESWSLENGGDLLHGEAIAAGMLCELWISHKIYGFPMEEVNNYNQMFQKYFDPFRFSNSLTDNLLERMQHDKKNTGQSLRFVLIKSIEQAIYDVQVSPEIVRQSLEFYLQTANKHV
jgi:3-dehydroquinate synthase